MLSLHIPNGNGGEWVGQRSGADSRADMLPIKMEDHSCMKVAPWAGEMAKWQRALTAVPEDLDSRLSSRMVVHRWL